MATTAVLPAATKETAPAIAVTLLAKEADPRAMVKANHQARGVARTKSPRPSVTTMEHKGHYDIV